METDYFKMPGYSNSALGWFKVSPEYYKFMLDSGGVEPTPAMALGTATHLLTFEPENFDKRLVVLKESERPFPDKDYRTPDNKKWKDSIFLLAKAENKEVIEEAEFKKAQAMAEKLLNVPESRDLIKYTRSKFEQPSTWDWNGMKFKGKLDIDSDLFITDLKTASSADTYEFQRSLFKWDIHRQLGMYADGDRINRGTEIFKQVFVIAIESEAPYGVSVHQLTDEVLERGVEEYRALALRLRECEKADKWPTYTCKSPEGINQIFLPKYMKNEGD